jgi:hypothetical protein
MLLGACLLLAFCQPAIVRSLPALVQPFLVLQTALVAGIIVGVSLLARHGALPRLLVGLRPDRPDTATPSR